MDARHSRPWQLLVLSVKTPSALDTATANLGKYLQQHSHVHLADVAYTYQIGRQVFKHRRMLVCHNREDGAIALLTLDPKRIFTNASASPAPPVVFMFSGQGAQYVNMGQELYQTEPTFQGVVDDCAEILKPHVGLDLRHLLYDS